MEERPSEDPRKCVKCGYGMSKRLAVIDPHTVCRQCRGQICTAIVSCEECAYLTPEVRNEIYLIEKDLQRKLDSRRKRKSEKESSSDFDSSCSSFRSSSDRNSRDRTVKGGGKGLGPSVANASV